MSETPTRIAILAGTYDQFRHYCREENINPAEAVFVTSIKNVRGTRFTDYRRTGTWYELRNSADLLAAVKARLR